MVRHAVDAAHADRLNYAAPAAPHRIDSWFAAASRLIAALRLRYWIALAFIFSGRAMLPLVADPSGPSSKLTAAIALLLRFWLPYLLVRAMAGERRPGAPQVQLLLFAPVALAFTLVEEALLALAVPKTNAQALGVHLAAALVTLPLVPLYAGTATARLSPLERPWLRALQGAVIPFAAAILGLAVARFALLALLPPDGSAFTLPVILWNHLRQLVVVASLLLFLGLSLAACNRALLRAREQAG